jgi:CRISPR-associated protein Cst1
MLPMTRSVMYVGDPFVDTGVAVLEHQIGKACEEFTDADLLGEGQALIKIYTQKSWRGALTFHFPNSGWTNPTMGPENVAKFRENVLKGFLLKSETGRLCEYCGRPANLVVDGSTIPLLSSAGSMECGPGGRTGFAVCGYCLLAVQFYPLATLKVAGKALFWWSHDRDWTYLLSGIAVREVRRYFAASPDGAVKPKFPWTRLLSVTRQAFEEWRADPERIALRDIVGCHTTNYRTSPEFDELHIPQDLFLFWDEAKSNYGSLYDAVITESWKSRRPTPAAARKTKANEDTEWERRNGFYEDLGSAFEVEDFRQNAVAVAKKYFIKIEKTASQPGSFDLACLFLERLAGMRKDRVAAIKEIGDRIAQCRDSEKVLSRLYNSWKILDTLMYAQKRMRDAGEAPLPFETILLALDMVSDDDRISQDWSLVRSLVILRTLEMIDPERARELPEPLTDESPVKGKED